MKKYKEFQKEYIGCSDIAALILAGPTSDGVSPKMLNFGEDGTYYAYMVDQEDVEIPDHYKLVYECQYWLKIYDDDGLAKEINARNIKVYEAGYFGCIIQYF